ncbi:fimbria/pilus outer membrane usher protein [Enterobacter asburiae]|uniref:fimbria/pilus outer membrane usher protein n=1 Tax=Enterobacter asburiae TaxID=61645 RepID=UPI0021CE86C4|nr:fimbria/pilus outer membrane usher protein [Enterobacter asburiae]MCU6239858.1 fimbrial biogenesis outer membrane usher protein [Enterobacter asburiae]HDX4066349.1 fimbrial biogenesis outer membrane usher protein [Enterobacter asburiae]HDX4066454.1 fimbrial biogenesis outer membrane usher protein [Enterobacter asburiae]
MKSSCKKRPQFRVSRVAVFLTTQLVLWSGVTEETLARDYFNPALLELGTPGQKGVDLSSFENQGGQMPGTYRVDIYINNQKVDTRDVEFKMRNDESGKEKLTPCLPMALLDSWGVLIKKYPTLDASDSTCGNISAIPQATSNFKFNQQQLLLTFPQSSMSNSAQGWVDPKTWDDGIPAFLLNYSASGANNYAKNNNGYDSENQYVNLRPGINIGPWRVRNYTTWTRSSSDAPGNDTQSHWDTVYTYAQRPVVALKSELTAGDSSSPSDVFDSIPYRGVQLASDDDMLPDSLKGYAPIVRGIARTNAQVTIRQNGYVIYQTYVSPGAFEISDMYPTGSSGDLNVTIKESDGSEQLLVIPYASLPVLQREGRFKYSVTSGVYRSYDHSVDKTPLTQATAIYGLPNGFTAYGGGQFASQYQSLAMGLGKNLGDLGAVSLDMTQAWATMSNQQKENGQSWRLRYSKNFVDVGTNFAIAGYRYATDGYWNMSEVLDSYRDTNYTPMPERRRNRTELTVSQALGDHGGSLSLSAVNESYYNSDKTVESYGVGYNNSWHSISYGLNYSYNRNSYSSDNASERYDEDQIFSSNVSIPFSIFEKTSRTSVSYMLNTDKEGNTTNSMSLSGTTLEQNNLSWSLQEGYGSQGVGNSGSMNADWRATYGEVNGGYSYDKQNQRLNYGIQGGIIAHENGITLGQPLGDTAVLVAAQGASGVSVQNNTGVKTDFRGYALVPYATPYRKNNITLDPLTFGEDTEVSITTQTVVPTRGAVVRAKYQTSVGYRVLMDLIRDNGMPVPFGAMVTDSSNKADAGFIVGDQGQVYLSGLSQSGSLLVKWGDASDEQCRVDYQLPDNTQGIVNINGKCH